MSAPASFSREQAEPGLQRARARTPRLLAWARPSSDLRLNRSNIGRQSRDEGAGGERAAGDRFGRDGGQRYNFPVVPPGDTRIRRLAVPRGLSCPTSTRIAFASSAAPGAVASCASRTCAGLRPTPDRVRETLFNWLGQDLTGKRCLDLYAGTGALSLEAISRGAALAVAVDRSRAAGRRVACNGRDVRGIGARSRMRRRASVSRRRTAQLRRDLSRPAVRRRSMGLAAARVRRAARSGRVRLRGGGHDHRAAAAGSCPGAATRRGRCIIIFSSCRGRVVTGAACPAHAACTARTLPRHARTPPARSPFTRHAHGRLPRHVRPVHARPRGSRAPRGAASSTGCRRRCRQRVEAAVLHARTSASRWRARCLRRFANVEVKPFSGAADGFRARRRRRG